MSAQNQHPNDPNKGLNVKVFLIAVIAGGCVIAVFLFFFLKAGGTKVVPKAAGPNPHPTSRLVQPAVPGAHLTSVPATA